MRVQFVKERNQMQTKSVADVKHERGEHIDPIDFFTDHDSHSLETPAATEPTRVFRHEQTLETFQ